MTGGLSAILSRIFGFLRKQDAAVGAFFVLTIPLLLLMGGLATDVSLLNAQKRHVQSQADLAAESAVRLIPDAAKARAAAQKVVNANRLYDSITLSRDDVQFGTVNVAGDFVKVANQTTGAGATAVQVRVVSRFSPILLGPVIGDDTRMVSRSALAGQESIAAFTLRNRLLRVDTREALLDPILSAAGLGLRADAIDYRGLADADVSLERVLGLASLQAGLQATTLSEALAAPVGLKILLDDLVAQGALPAAAVLPNVPNRTVNLGNFLAASPGAAKVELGQVAGPLTVNAFDLLMGVLGQGSDPSARINIATGLDLYPLASVRVSVGILRPPVTVIVRPSDTGAPHARMAQISVNITANILGVGSTELLRLTGAIDVGTASAQLTALNCGVTAPTATLARFNVATGVSEVGLQVGLLQSDAGISDRNVNKLQVSASTSQVDVSLSQLGTPVLVPHALTISSLAPSLTSALNGLTSDISAKVSANACQAGLVSLLTCPLFTVVNATVKALMTTLQSVSTGITSLLTQLGVDPILRAVLNLFGISIAQAEIILEDYSCQGRLMR